MSEPAGPRPRFPIGLTIASAIALAILLWLGTWQVQRLQWKADLIDRIEAARAAPPLPASDALALPEPEFRSAVVDCPAEALNRRIEVFGLLDGDPGRRLVVACPLPGGGVVLTDLGFVDETISARPLAAAPARVSGVLRRPDPPSVFNPPGPRGGVWFARDSPRMAAALGADRAAPLFLSASQSAMPEWQALKPAPLPDNIPNRHLEYALTWYGLAGVLIAFYGAMLWRRRRPR